MGDLRLCYLLVISLVLVLLISGCDRENPLPPVHRFPQETIDYLYFREGTSWIYSDSVSGAYQTVNVIEDTMRIDEYIDQKTEEVLERWETMEVMFDDYHFKLNPDGSCKTANSHTNCAYISVFDNVVRDKSDTWGWIPAIKQHSLTYDKGLSVYGYFDTLVVAGKDYYEVIAFQDNANVFYDSKATITYMAPHFGIIKTIVCGSINNGDCYGYPEAIWNLYWAEIKQ